MELPVLLPPEEEQTLILIFLNAEMKKLDTLRKEALCAVDLLKERRSALITAAVTGQIDVRNLTSEVPA
jgi:type I restriction enzyme S subunit